jgi:hypothetical protein
VTPTTNDDQPAMASPATQDDAPPASAEESMRLIREQRARTGRSLVPDPRLMYWPWGIAWLVGFGLLYLRFGPDGRVLVNMPVGLPLTTLFVLMGGALVVTTIGGVRAGRHVSGESSVKGLTYGLTWFFGFTGLGVTAGYLSDFLPEAQVGLMWAAFSVNLVAVLYIAGAAVWSDRSMLVLGIWMMVSNIAGVLAGPGWHSLVISLAGGGGVLVAGLVAWLRLGRAR